MTLVRLWVALTMTYAVVVVSVKLLVLGSVVMDGPTLTAIVAVPAVQTLVVTAIRRWRRRAS